MLSWTHRGTIQGSFDQRKTVALHDNFSARPTYGKGRTPTFGQRGVARQCGIRMFRSTLAPLPPRVVVEVREGHHRITKLEETTCGTPERHVYSEKLAKSRPWTWLHRSWVEQIAKIYLS